MKYDYSQKLNKIFLTGVYDGCVFNDIYMRESSFGIKKRELENALSNLLKEGKVKKRGEKYYADKEKRLGKEKKSDENAVFIVGVLRTNERGFGFLSVDGDKDYYVAPQDLGDALSGDRAEAIKVFGRGTNDSARITKVIERGRDSVVGTFFTEGALSYVRPDDKNYLSDIYIPTANVNGARMGEKVFVKIVKYVKMRCPEGKVEAILGSPFLMETEENAIIFSYALNEDFSPQAMEKARLFKQKVDDNALIGRLNLEDALIFTIDGDSAKDFDDAVSLEKTDDGNYLLGVHIADVSEYVIKGDEIDKCAFKRATSVYFPDRVIPMLPFELADGLCSLVEGERRLTVSVFCEIDNGGKVINTDFKKSFIRSRKRLTYAMVDALFSGDGKIKKELSDIADTLFEMKKLSEILKENRRENGYVDLDVKESDILINDGIIDVKLHESTAATELIEQFMITANEAVASFLFYQSAPCIYRIHEKPTREKTTQLKEFAAALGIKFNLRKDECYPKDIQRLLTAAKGRETAALINKTVLRSMAKAKYSTLNAGHFGLASKCYCHFTSPIRRYPDLNVHRSLKYLLDGNIDELTGLEEYFEAAATVSSQQERNAEEAERAMDDLYKARYLEDRIGEEYVGVISGVTANGAFVGLDNGCEVFCPIEIFPNGKYEFDRAAFSLKSARFDFSIGKKVGVKILGVDLGERKAQAAFTDLSKVRTCGKK